MKRIGLLIYFIVALVAVRGAEYTNAELKQAESLLKARFDRMTREPGNTRKLAIADSISGLLFNTLNLPGAFDYPFDSLKTLGKIKSNDQKIRIFTWNVPADDGTSTFYGFLLVREKKDNPPEVIKLNDQLNDVPDVTQVSLTPDRWLGCLIYAIVETNYAGISYYTLLGYDPHDFFVTRKIIDLLWFNEKHEPVFGKAVFHYQKRMQHRVIFEYSAKVSMSLQWNDNLKMIIFDHLSPSKQSQTGNYRYYGPDFSYDGLRFEKGIWEMVEDIDVRNSNK